MSAALVASLTLLAGALLTYRLSRPGTRLYVLDVPNERSLHERPTPRTGGLAIVAAALGGIVTLLVLLGQPAGVPWAIGAGALLVAGISFWDDHADLSPLARLAVQVVAALLLLTGGLGLPEDALGLPLGIAIAAVSLLLVVWLTNLYNFMDGMDGFAGGMGAIGFTVLGLMAYRGSHTVFGGVCLVLAAANLGFLVFNFPPARIFMGDVGSATLGFLVGSMTLWGVRDGVFPLWAPLLAFSPFVADATATLLRRMLKGERFWEPHRTHYYQRLVQLGWGHRRTVAWEYALMIGAGASALVLTSATYAPAVPWGLAAWIAVYVLLAQMVRWLEGPPPLGADRRAAGDRAR
jgi:UDP-N-acetylmuramyl pentapeptide phosphotransferase/UDP-N-acetylglucosamine-1-phosphate transferase